MCVSQPLPTPQHAGPPPCGRGPCAAAHSSQARVSPAETSARCCWISFPRMWKCRPCQQRSLPPCWTRFWWAASVISVFGVGQVDLFNNGVVCVFSFLTRQDAWAEEGMSAEQLLAGMRPHMALVAAPLGTSLAHRAAREPGAALWTRLSLSVAVAAALAKLQEIKV
jgi:hypothetical protein